MTNLRYFKKLDTLPGEPTYLRILGLFRQYYKGDVVHFEHFDRRKKHWVDHPELMLATGLGGATDFFNASRDEVLQTLTDWLGSAEKAQGALGVR